jgi:hypothetical protein
MLYKLVVLTKCFFTILFYSFVSLYLRERLAHFAHRNVTDPVLVLGAVLKHLTVLPVVIILLHINNNRILRLNICKIRSCIWLEKSVKLFSKNSFLSGKSRQ